MALPPPAPIRMYGTSWCGECWLAKAIFARNQVEYDWIDVHADPAAEAFVLEHNRGMRSVPTIVFPDGTVLVEPSARVLQAKLDGLRSG
jgi:mycoredoxin